MDRRGGRAPFTRQRPPPPWPRQRRRMFMIVGRAAAGQQLQPHEATRDSTRHNNGLSVTACDGRLRRARPGRGPSMACKGSGVQIPSAPPQHRRSKACSSFSVASCRCLIARFVPPACHSVLAAGSRSEPLQPRPAHPMRPRWRRTGRPSRAGSAARQPRRNAPSDQTAPVPPDLNFPHTQQVVVIQRHTIDLTGSNARTELVYALSSQPAHHASP